MASLLIDPQTLEGVFGWLEQNGGQPVQLWGWEDNRRAALLAYTDGPGDDFGWSNWVTKAYEDPSEILPLFGRLELVVEADVAASLTAAFPGLLIAG